MAPAAVITSDQHAATTGQHGNSKRADKTYGELENSVHAQISMPKAHKKASTPAAGAFAAGRPARTMRNVTPFERLPRRISSGDYSGKTYEPLERVNGKESVARVTAHALSKPQLPQQSSQAPASPSSTIISPKSQGLSLTPPQRILCCDKTTLKIHQHFPEDYDTAVRLLMENRKGRFPHRTVNALDFKIPWMNFDYIIGITTINHQHIEKESPRVLCFQLQSDAYRTECMEVLNRDLVVAHRQDDELLQKQCLIRTEGGVEFACETHTDMWFLCYRLLHWEGNAEETANMLSLREPVRG